MAFIMSANCCGVMLCAPVGQRMLGIIVHFDD